MGILIKRIVLILILVSNLALSQNLPNDLLNTLVQRGQVTHFVEKIPSMNDIFIQTVTEK